MIRFLFALAILVAPRVADACILEGTNPVVFGNYDVFANSDIAMMGGVRYRCLISLSIRIDLSTGSSSTYAMRTMQRTGGGSLSYQLYKDSGRTEIWGDGTNGSHRYGPYIGLLVSTTVPVHGVLFKKQDVPVGSYSDTIVVTLNY